MRLLTSVFASVAILVAAASANATVSFIATATTSGGDLNAVQIGDTITLNINIRSTGTPIFGLGAAVEDYRDIASFQSGNAVAGYLFEIAIPAVGAFNGLDNLSQGALVENAAGFVQIANSAGLTGRAGTGVSDPGLNGVIGGGDAQFRVTLVATAAGTRLISIGGSDDPALGNVAIIAGGASEAITNAFISVTVVPEPGTALLMGLGLAGLAAAGRRE